MDKIEDFKFTARIEEFDSFWEAPNDIEKGYYKFGEFYKYNYLKYFPKDRKVKILVISCGPGYMVNLLNKNGYEDVLGIDSIEKKVVPALEKKMNCKHASAYDYLYDTDENYDVIFCEQEINHMTKEEILIFLDLFKIKLKTGGALIIHSLNGANPIVGAENLALNFDHYNTFTESSLIEVLEYCGYKKMKVFPLKLYVFFKNPLNYIGLTIDFLLNVLFRMFYIFYGKKPKIFSKKIGVIAFK